MSHNITLGGLVVDDLDMLRDIVRQLSAGRAELDPQAKTFRTYRGQPNTCDAAIIMQDGQHDIGLKKLADGGYEIVFDPYALAPTFHNSAVGPSGYYKTNIGSLVQEYVLSSAEYTAGQNGMTTERVNGSSGVVSLKITG